MEQLDQLLPWIRLRLMLVLLLRVLIFAFLHQILLRHMSSAAELELLLLNHHSLLFQRLYVDTLFNPISLLLCSHLVLL